MGDITEKTQPETKVQHWVRRTRNWAENNPVIAPLIFFGIVVAAVTAVWKDLPAAFTSFQTAQFEQLARLFQRLLDGGWHAAFILSISILGIAMALVGWRLFVTRSISASAPLTWPFAAVVVGGICTSVAGLMALSGTRAAIQIMPASEIISRLYANIKVSNGVRLVPYDPATETNLAIGHLPKLGPESYDYTFVGDYDELRGRSAANAVQMLGGEINGVDHLSAIIFPTDVNVSVKDEDFPDFVPGNARGLLQVVDAIDNLYGKTDKQWKPVNVIDQLHKLDSKLADQEESDLKKHTLESWRWDSYAAFYSDYCQVARAFISGNYSARNKISKIEDDWHPLGFAQILPPGRENERDLDPCTVVDWNKKINSLQEVFGVRVFLIRNKKPGDLRDQVLIDFFQPSTQPIPDFAL